MSAFFTLRKEYSEYSHNQYPTPRLIPRSATGTSEAPHEDRRGTPLWPSRHATLRRALWFRHYRGIQKLTATNKTYRSTFCIHSCIEMKKKPYLCTVHCKCTHHICQVPQSNLQNSKDTGNTYKHEASAHKRRLRHCLYGALQSPTEEMAGTALLLCLHIIAPPPMTIQNELNIIEWKGLLSTL